MLIVRPAKPNDAFGMSAVLQEILTYWESPRPSSPDHVLDFYINHPDQLPSFVADRESEIVGFQSLKIALKNNTYDVTPGWGVIGTYVRLNLRGTGIGRSLFEKTLQAAKRSGLEFIDATISADNQNALAYYSAMGFVEYRRRSNTISKKRRV